MKDQYKIILFIIVLIFSLIFISSCNNANEPKEDYFYMCNYFSDKNLLNQEEKELCINRFLECEGIQDVEKKANCVSNVVSEFKDDNAAVNDCLHIDCNENYTCFKDKCFQLYKDYFEGLKIGCESIPKGEDFSARGFCYYELSEKFFRPELCEEESITNAKCINNIWESKPIDCKEFCYDNVFDLFYNTIFYNESREFLYIILEGNFCDKMNAIGKQDFCKALYYEDKNYCLEIDEQNLKEECLNSVGVYNKEQV